MGLPTSITITIAADEYRPAVKRADGSVEREAEVFGSDYAEPLALRWPTRHEFRSVMPSRATAALESEGVRDINNQAETTTFYTHAQVLFTTLAKETLPAWAQGDQPFSVKGDAAIRHAYFKALREISDEKKGSAATGIISSAAA